MLCPRHKKRGGYALFGKLVGVSSFRRNLCVVRLAYKKNK